MCLAQGHNAVTPVRLQPAAPQSQVKHSTTEPLRSLHLKLKMSDKICENAFEKSTKNLNILHAGYFFMLLLSSANFFQSELFPKILSGTLPECQTVWIQIKTDILSVMIWVQTVCKGYQQTT